MTHGTLTESITRSLAYMLRHQPDEFDLELDPEGWGDLEDVTQALNERLGEPIEEDDVAEAIQSGDRQRYEIKDGRIRALYGHSFTIEPGEPAEPPDQLYIGVGSRDAERAEERGLRSGRRAFLHLALEYDDAKEMGRRAAPEYAVITVNAADAWEEGVEFYDRISLFLAESIDTEYLEVSEIFTDGIRRERRGGGRGGRRDERGDNRVRGRRRPEEREERSDRHERRERPERKERPERSERPERKEREESPRPPRREPKPESKPESVDAPASSFGAGLVGDPPAPEPAPEPEVAPEPVVAEEPEPTPEPVTEEPATEEPAADGGGFGAGL